MRARALADTQVPTGGLPWLLAAMLAMILTALLALAASGLLRALGVAGAFSTG